MFLSKKNYGGGPGYEAVNDIYVESSSFVLAGTVDGSNGFDMFPYVSAPTFQKRNGLILEAVITNTDAFL